MVTGSPPFGGETPAVIVAKRLSEPTPSPRERRPTVSPATSRLIQRMMAREQRQRFQTAAELIEGIERAQRGELPAARPAAGRRPAARRRPVPRARRASPTPWILAGVGAVAALVVVAVLASRPQPGGEPEDEAVLRAATRTAVPKGRRPDPAAQLAIEAAALRARMAPLLAGGRFGEALALVGGFATKHPSPQGADAAATLRREVRTRAEARYGALVAEADEAARGKDYAKARAAMAPARAFGLPDFADRARRKLAEIDEREKHAALWAKWDAIREKSQKLADAGKWDEAVAALAPAKALALRRIGQLIAEQTRAVGRTRRKAIDAAASAYAKESDRAWALFGQRQYAEAQRLLDKLAADKAHRLAADRVAADGEAAKCLRRFWARVEDGVRALEGRQLAIDGPVGTVKRVKDGVVTIESGGVEVDRRVDQMTTEQAVGIAGLGRDAGERLLLGVFLLAEGRKLDEATKALAAAGKSRAVAIFRERLAAVKREPKGHGFTTQWTRLFDGRTLDGWRVIRSFPKVAKAGRVGVGMGVIGLWEDGGRTGIAWDGGFPTDGYEVLIEAQWVRAGGRFCHVVFPVGETHGVLAVCDGHVGLGNVDGRRASDNATTTRGKFRKGQWYTIRLRVGSSRVQASIDGERVVDFATGGARLSLRPGLWPARPFGLVSERSRAAFRHVQVRMLSGKGATPKR